MQNTLNERAKPLKGSRVHVLGIAYKRDVDDVRESPALDVILLLQRRGALVTYSDPWIPKICLDERELVSIDPLEMASTADCCVVITDHSAFNYDALLQRSRTIVDARNVYKGRKSPKIVRL